MMLKSADVVIENLFLTQRGIAAGETLLYTANPFLAGAAGGAFYNDYVYF